MADVQVVKQDPITGVYSFGMSRPPKFVEGVSKLVQIVVIELMTTPGRNVLDPSAGGNLQSLIGSNVTFDDEAEIFTEIQMMIRTAESNIKERQVNSNRPSNERLSALYLLDVVPDEENASLEIIVKIVSEDQQDAEAIVGLK